MPEPDLWIEVILQAIRDLNTRKASDEVLFAKRSAQRWFVSDDEEIGSFIWTCHMLNVEPSVIRAMIMKMHRTEL
jgi:hypothetical protein